jgi:hypothetical protein
MHNKITGRQTRCTHRRQGELQHAVQVVMAQADEAEIAPPSALSQLAWMVADSTSKITEATIVMGATEEQAVVIEATYMTSSSLPLKTLVAKKQIFVCGFRFYFSLPLCKNRAATRWRNGSPLLGEKAHSDSSRRN